MRYSFKSLKNADKFLGDMDAIAKELEKRNSEFNQKVFIVQAQFLDDISDSLRKVWNAQSEDSILKETHESTTWFWISNFKHSPFEVNRNEFAD